MGYMGILLIYPKPSSIYLRVTIRPRVSGMECRAQGLGIQGFAFYGLGASCGSMDSGNGSIHESSKTQESLLCRQWRHGWQDEHVCK